LCASDCQVSREDQDAFAISSYTRAQKANEEGKFKNEIVAVEIKDRKGQITVMDTDEEIHAVKFEKIPDLKPVFKKDGTVTAANARAIPKAIERSGLKPSEIDFYEINEAFSVVSIANNRMLKLDPEKVNVNGGAVSMGHPLGASGARIVVTLMHVLQQNKGK